MITIGHHTCKKDGGKDYVLKNAPFFAEVKMHKDGVRVKKSQFLGPGYYFWDNHIEVAKSWGDTHCFDSYYIVSCEIDISEQKCYDLVGSRSHQIHLIDFWRKMSSIYGFSMHKWTLSKLITLLREFASSDSEVFDFDSVRAIDYEKTGGVDYHHIQFVKDNPRYTVLAPRMAICVFAKESLPLQSKEIVFESLN